MLQMQRVLQMAKVLGLLVHLAPIARLPSNVFSLQQSFLQSVMGIAVLPLRLLLSAHLIFHVQQLSHSKPCLRQKLIELRCQPCHLQ